MIKQNTVFILGAGASAPYNFPTGYNLNWKIIDNFRSRMTKIAHGKNPYMVDNLDKEIAVFLDQFKGTPQTSIDLFLNRHRSIPFFSELGKKAIILSLLDSEKESLVYFTRRNNAGNWYSSIFQYMLNGLENPDSYKQFGDNKITFITFNYDRSLEYYLHYSLSKNFSETLKDENKEAYKEVINKINIIHVYGQLGPLPWQNKMSASPISSTRIESLGYGETTIDYDYLNLLTEYIQTIPERISIPKGDPIWEALAYAEHIFFLGFSFGEENMNMLKETINNIPQHTSIYCTVKGLEQIKIDKIWNQYFNTHFPNGWRRHVWKTEDMDSDALLKKYLLD
ncbi:MAG: SIR2 family protein [Ignavibacteriaceae bacterium]|nr:SIR2 family protein [Ignavibacteriaceae bacterium]